MRSLAMLLLLVLGLASSAFADAPRGRYEFNDWKEVVIADRKLPSCGSEANVMLDAYTKARVVVRDSIRVRVNGEMWKIPDATAQALMVQKPDLGDVVVGIRLWRHDERAAATLVYARMVDKKPVCLDMRSLRGTYREPPWKFWTG